MVKRASRIAAISEFVAGPYLLARAAAKPVHRRQ